MISLSQERWGGVRKTAGAFLTHSLLAQCDTKKKKSTASSLFILQQQSHLFLSTEMSHMHALSPSPSLPLTWYWHVLGHLAETPSSTCLAPRSSTHLWAQQITVRHNCIRPLALYGIKGAKHGAHASLTLNTLIFCTRMLRTGSYINALKVYCVEYVTLKI